MLKKLFLITIIVLAFTTLLFADGASVKLSWMKNAETDVCQYGVYQSDVSGVYNINTPVAAVLNNQVGDKVETIIAGLSSGTHYWVVTAINTSGLMSKFSNEVSKTINATAPDLPATLQCETVIIQN
jgi:hypothetical protein